MGVGGELEGPGASSPGIRSTYKAPQGGQEKNQSTVDPAGRYPLASRPVTGVVGRAVSPAHAMKGPPSTMWGLGPTPTGTGWGGGGGGFGPNGVRYSSVELEL